MKHEWLADQTQLVSSATETENLAEKVGAWREEACRQTAAATVAVAVTAATATAVELELL